jgi:hypothetical protein
MHVRNGQRLSADRSTSRPEAALINGAPGPRTGVLHIHDDNSGLLLWYPAWGAADCLLLRQLKAPGGRRARRLCRDLPQGPRVRSRQNLQGVEYAWLQLMRGFATMQTTVLCSQYAPTLDACLSPLSSPYFLLFSLSLTFPFRLSPPLPPDSPLVTSFSFIFLRRMHNCAGCPGKLRIGSGNGLNSTSSSGRGTVR